MSEKKNERIIVYHDCTDDKPHGRNVEKMTPLEKKEFHKRNVRVSVVAVLTPNNSIQAGIAICSGYDTIKKKNKAGEEVLVKVPQSFDRKKGYEIASLRLAKHPIEIGSISGVDQKDFIACIKAAGKFVRSYAHTLRKSIVNKSKNHRSLNTYITNGLVTNG